MTLPVASPAVRVEGDVDLASMLNAALDGHNIELGLRFVKATRNEVIAEIVVGPKHHQAYGIVHGGVYSSMIETACSVGGAMQAAVHGANAVGLENHTSFLHAVREGTLQVTATPVECGRRTQLWQATVVVASRPERAVASGRVRMYVMEQGAALAGEHLHVKEQGGR